MPKFSFLKFLLKKRRRDTSALFFFFSSRLFLPRFEGKKHYENIRIFSFTKKSSSSIYLGFFEFKYSKSILCKFVWNLMLLLNLDVPRNMGLQYHMNERLLDPMAIFLRILPPFLQKLMMNILSQKSDLNSLLFLFLIQLEIYYIY